MTKERNAQVLDIADFDVHLFYLRFGISEQLDGFDVFVVRAHAGRQAARSVPGTKLARRAPKRAMKRAGERLMRLVAGLQSDLDHGSAPVLEPMGGPFQAQSAHVLSNRLADQAAEHPMKMKRREAGDRRQSIQREILVEMVLDVDENPQNALFIVSTGRGRVCRSGHVLKLAPNLRSPLDRSCSSRCKGFPSHHDKRRDDARRAVTIRPVGRIAEENEPGAQVIPRGWVDDSRYRLRSCTGRRSEVSKH